MPLVLNEDQVLLKETARAFMSERAPVSALRALRDSRDPTGFSRELWREMAELGWAGIHLPEDYGGSDFGFVGLGVLLEEAGRTLAATPLVSTVLLAASALLLGGSEAQRRHFLPAIARGETVMALAVDEGPHHAPARIALAAEAQDGGFRLSGEKTLVLDGHVADTLIVAARTSGRPGETRGITLFLVPGDAPGLSRSRLMMVDSRNAARLGFDRVQVGADAVLGPLEGGFDILDQVLDRGRIGLAAEMLGAASAAFDMTLAWLKERSQFGRPIGSFQALQHRAARMFCELELTRSTVLDALAAVDERRNDLPQAASLAKARAGETFFTVSNEAIQMHGGIGMTDEHDIGFYLKRARVAQASLGDSRFHRDRYARLEGF